MFTCTWRCHNATNYVQATDCYKIISCDPLDDTVDQFSNIVSGVAATLAKTNYSKKEWSLFYESIIYLYNYERMLYNKLTSSEQNNLLKKLLESITKIEKEVDKRR